MLKKGKEEIIYLLKYTKTQLRNNWIIAGTAIFLLATALLLSINSTNKKRSEIATLRSDFKITPFAITAI